MTARGTQKNKKLFSRILPVMLTVVLVAGFLFFVSPSPAHAWFGAASAITDLTISAVTSLVKIVGAIILTMLGVFIGVAALLIIVPLAMGVLLTHPDATGFLVQGWTIFRDLANLGFVLGIIVIAIGTIVRYKSYTVQSLLPKLVVAALLVNFSLVLAVPFIQLSDSFSFYYLGQITGVGSGDTVSMFNAAKNQFISITQPIDVLKNADASNARGVDPVNFGLTMAASDMRTIIEVTYAIFIGAIIMFTLLGLGVVLFIRFYYLAFLLMISPVAWVLWIFPQTSGNFKKWWEKFIHWNIFPPVVLFFVYLALALTKSSSVTALKTEVTSLAGKGTLGGLLVNSSIMPLLAIGMILGGMKVASILGVEGGNIATGAAGKVVDYTKGKAKEYGARGGARITQSKVGQNVLGKVKMTTNKVPLIGGMMTRGIMRGEASLNESVKAADQAKLKGISDKNRAEAAKTLSGNAKYIEMARAIEDGLGGSYSAQDMKMLVDGLRGMGKHNEAQKALRLKFLDDNTLSYILAGNTAAAVTAQRRVISSMNSSEIERAMKNDGKNIAEGKYLGYEKSNPIMAAALQKGIYEASYNDPAAMRSMAGNIHSAPDREKYLLDGVPGRLSAYKNRIADKAKSQASMTAEINKLDARKASGPLSSDDERALASLVKGRDKLNEELTKLQSDLLKIENAYATGDVGEVKKAMEFSSDAEMKSYASGMKLV